MNFQSNSNTNSNTSNQPNTSYPKLIDEVNKFWQQKLSEMDKIKSDIKELERMFNDYGNNSSFIDCKTVLVDLLENNQRMLNSMEEQFYVLKRNFNIN